MSKRRQVAGVLVVYDCPEDNKRYTRPALTTFADHFGASINATVLCECGKMHEFDITYVSET